MILKIALVWLKQGKNMKDTVRVIALKENNIVEVVPLITDACINCKSTSCTKQGHPFTVHNSNNLPVSQNSIVKISASKTALTVQSLFSLVFPLAAAVAGYLLTPKFCRFFFKLENVKESALVAGVFISFACATTIVLLLNNLLKISKNAFITEIITGNQQN